MTLAAVGVRLRLPNPGAFGESEEKKSGGIGSEQIKMSQSYQNFPKFGNLSVKIAPDLKGKIGFVAKKKKKKWASFQGRIQGG